MRRPLSRVSPWALVLGFYVTMALVTIGRHAIAHPRTVCACVGTEDPALFMWGLAWWPHALIHGLNPFVTHYLWSPAGVNTAQATLMPTASIVLAPVTAAFGPLFSYNVLAVASCALSAFTAYLLCRRLVAQELPAAAGGYLFGFSPYMFGQLTGHLNLTLIFLIPVMVLLALKRVDRELSRWVYVIGMAVALILQAGLSTELLAECVGFGAAMLIAARFLASQPQRSRVNGLIAETVGAGLLAALLASPFFYYALFNGEFPKGVAPYGDVYAEDLLNLIFPTEATWLGHSTFKSLSATFTGGGVTGQDGYLGVLLIAVFLVWAMGRERRFAKTRIVVIGALLGTIGALGSHLHIAGQQTVTLPFGWVQSWPIFNDIVPSRMALFTSLAVSIGVAAWLARRTGRVVTRWLVVLAGAVMLFPNVTSALYGVAPHNPRFFRASVYQHYIAPGETVLALPYGHVDTSMLWQAESGFRFYMPEGYISQVVPPPFNVEPVVVDQLWLNMPTPATALGAFIRSHYVSHVVVDAAAAGFWPEILSQLGLHGRHLDGVILYDVRSTA